MPNGLVRWAFNNLAHANTPSCKAVALELYKNPKAYSSPSERELPNSNDANYWPNTTATGMGGGLLVVEAGGPDGMDLKNAGTPKAGMHTLTFTLGEVGAAELGTGWGVWGGGADDDGDCLICSHANNSAHANQTRKTK